MPLSRRQISQVYRPLGPKAVQFGNAWVSGGSLNLAQVVDLSLPLRGFRIVFKGRLVIGGADLASVKPEALQNLIARILITGTNSRQKGNVTLWDMDFATLLGIQQLFDPTRAYAFDVNGAEIATPSMPYASGGIPVTQGTYDFRFVADLPAYPFNSPAGVRPGFAVRSEEWKDSIQIQMTFATVAGGAVQGPFGTGQAATTLTLSSFGSGAGTPTIDVYSLPTIMGLDLKDGVVPGFLTRVVQPIGTILQSAGTGVTLITLQKQNTSRVFLKIGTSTQTPSFLTLSDTNVTALGIALGGNRNVRNRLDVFAHKQEIIEQYGSNPIQGYNVLDFVESGNPDSAYPGDQVDPGTTIQLTADVVGVANAYAHTIQEQMLYRPEGGLYSF